MPYASRHRRHGPAPAAGNRAEPARARPGSSPALPLPELAAKFEAAGMRFSGIAVDPDPVALRGLVELVEQDRLRAHVQETFPFDRVTDAHRLLDAGHLQGKLVLTV